MVDVDCFIQHLEASKDALNVEVDLREGDRVLAKGSSAFRLPLPPPIQWFTAFTSTILVPSNYGTLPARICIRCTFACCAELRWSTKFPRTIGFREAQFTDHGFELNGKVIKLRGLDRHQTFPWVGQAMPGRVAAPRRANSAQQAQDAILCGHRTIPSHVTFSTPAMRLACWCWRRFLAGNTSATSPGS